MRRKDREMDRNFGLNLIDNAAYGILSVIDESIPYSLPLSIVRDGDTIYFHSSKEGKKVGLLKDDTHVNVVFVGNTKVPENFTKEELEDMARDESKGVKFISSVFTTEFESSIITGKVREVLDKGKKIDVLRLICEKYTPDKMDYFDIAINSGLGRVNVYAIDIEDITAKRKKYDLNGEEMKWGRMS